MSYEIVLLEAQENMEKAVEFTVREFNSLHTGKASPSLVENLQVNVKSYGSSMHLREIAAITTPDARTIQVQPWDKSIVQDVEKAIQTANLGLNPTVAGTVIHIHIPELSRERRKELVKIAHSMAEEGRISVRHTRRDALEALKKMQKDGEISEDDLKRYDKEVQKETDSHVEKIGKQLARKENDLTTL